MRALFEHTVKRYKQQCNASLRPRQPCSCPATVVIRLVPYSDLRGRTYRALRARCARAVRKVGHSPPPVGSFLGVGLPQGTIAIVYPCSINPPPSCVYVPLQTGTLRPVYGDTFSGCLPRGIIFCSHFSDPLLHSPWTLMLEIGCSTLAPMGCEFLPQWWGLRPTD